MIRKVAIVGAGASGAAAAAALDAEEYFEEIKVFERRGTAGGTWIYDANPGQLPLTPGALPPQTDRPLRIPDRLPQTTPCCTQYRFEQTPIYEGLTTNVPDVAMSFSDIPFAYGPFVPHSIPRQYIENYFSWHRLDPYLKLRTTVEDITALPHNRWNLVLRHHDAARQVDEWWEEEFDAVIIANGHYSIPFVPSVPGIEEFRTKFPNRIEHSKTYRTPRNYIGQRVVVVGNSASGFDVAHQLSESGVLEGKLYVSRRSRGRWDGTEPPPGIEWKPIITQFCSDGTIHFADGTVLHNIDKVIYCTGYQPSYPFWNSTKNGRPLYSYSNRRLINNYQHTFLHDFPTLALIGFPRVLTFRSFEYQATAISRLWSGRNSFPLPAIGVKIAWEKARADLVKKQGRKFHQIDWEDGETMDWFRWLFEFAGLPRLEGQGKCPPVLGERTRWAIEHVKKYPDRGDGEGEGQGSKRGTLWFV